MTAPALIPGNDVSAWMVIREATSRSCRLKGTVWRWSVTPGSSTSQDGNEVSRRRLQVAEGVGLLVLGEHVRRCYALARVCVGDEVGPIWVDVKLHGTNRPGSLHNVGQCAHRHRGTHDEHQRAVTRSEERRAPHVGPVADGKPPP